MRRFYLQRNHDASGVSGLGKVAEGCQFDTGWCALVWLTGKSAMSYYPDIETIVNIHGHQGMTQVTWIDDESSNVIIRCDSSSAMLCEHANECPQRCPCPAECYCKVNTRKT